MSLVAKLKNVYLRYFSAPKSDRIIYRSMRKNRTRSIVEIGMGSISRSRNLIDQAQQWSSEAKVSYTAIDLFDSRPHDLPPLKLIETHRTLCKTGAVVKLVPGDENSALARIANALTNTDLILISTCTDIQSQTQLWFYLPRMLNDKSLVFRQVTGETGERRWKQMGREEITSLSKSIDRWAA